MRPVPVIVTITDLRRHATGIIEGAVTTQTPVYVTQYGYAMVVLIARERYDTLLQTESECVDLRLDGLHRLTSRLASDKSRDRLRAKDECAETVAPWSDSAEADIPETPFSFTRSVLGYRVVGEDAAAAADGGERRFPPSDDQR